MSDVGTGVFAKGRVVPEDVVALSAFPFACFGWFVMQGVLVSTFIECLQSSVMMMPAIISNLPSHRYT